MRRLPVLVCLGMALLGTSAWAFVGLTDTCPLPTPYPPASAGAGVIFNGNMEGGFTSGVANQWTAFKASGLPGQVHFAGTDRFFAGAASQKFNMPQPTVTTEQVAGIYQRIWVVPGASYTATVKIYMQFGAESYEGEDLVAQLGLDPYGEDNGVGSGMVKTGFIGTKNAWFTATITATAQLPVMTLSLQAIRKFAMHGNGALAWFDEVTFSGPAPSGTRPGPGQDPIDPETLISTAVGPNLVTNSSFETFPGTVAANWNSWSTSGAGTWKRSRRVGKVGAARYYCGSTDAIGQMNPKTVLLLGGSPPAGNPGDPGGSGDYPVANTLAANYPEMEDAIIIGRPYVDPNDATYLSNPTFYGTQLANQMNILQQQYPRIDCWQGLNEPDTGDQWQKVVSFEKAFADRAHQLGMKTVALSLSTGSPAIIWRMVDQTYNPSCHNLLDVADYMGQHVYGGPTDDLAVTNQVTDNVCEFAMRPRRFKDMYDRRGWRLPPILATEGNSWAGKTAQWGDTAMNNDLTTLGNYMNFNNWWCGYTHFTVGSCGWTNFDISTHPGIISAVGAWNFNNPSDAKNGLYSQMFGAGKVHLKTAAEATPAGLFNGGINQQLTSLVAGQTYVAKAWMKWEFRGHQPTQLQFYLGVDPTGQTSNGNSATIDWGANQIATTAPIHEIFSHVWRTFVPTATTASLWLRSSQTVSDPSFMCYVDDVQVYQSSGTPVPAIERSPTALTPSTTVGSSPANGSFTVRNSGSGTLNYSIGADQSWLSVTPTGGTSTGGANPHTVTYSTVALAAGTHNATVTISDPSAANTPQTITVTLTVNPPSGGGLAEDFETLPAWSSSFDAAWGSAATWSIVSGGQSGNALQATRGAQGSSSKTTLYSISANTNYTLTVYIKCPIYTANTYWAECALKLGNNSASDFDNNPGTWTYIQAFGNAGTNGNGNTWTQYSKTFSSSSSTQVTVGFKLGAQNGSGPTVLWDTLRINGSPPASATIALSASTLAPLTTKGINAASQTFTVRNSGAGSLNYSISDDGTWLGVAPGSGASTGETDTITVNYTTSTLAIGSYNATISVTDAQATNSPQMIPIVLSVLPIPGDLNADGAIDNSDFALFSACFTGPDLGPPTVACGKADLDHDVDVDQSDFAVMQKCFSGDNIPADPHCAN